VARDPYVYPGTHTLRNRYGVRDPAALSRLEATFTAGRLAELGERPIAGVYDLAHLQALHRHVFGDVYAWAGEIRSVAIAKGDLFALPEHIASYLGGVLAQLPGEQHLRGLDREAFIDRLTHYLAEINATHPFREGNGRTQRAFVQQGVRAVRPQRERLARKHSASRPGDLPRLVDQILGKVPRLSSVPRDRDRSPSQHQYHSSRTSPLPAWSVAPYPGFPGLWG
jgi:cell filamentation protein